MGNDIALFGGLLVDRYFYIDRWPVRGQDGFCTGEEAFVGGCSVNMAVTIQNLGGSAHIVSCIGSDRFGQTIRTYLNEHELSRQLVHSVPGTTGTSLVFAEPEGERTFFTCKGVDTDFPEILAQKVLDLAPAWAGVTGYYLLGKDAPCILDCLESLHQDGTKILFDPSPMVGEIRPDLLTRMVALSDVLTPNAAELPALGGEDRLPALVDGGKTVILKRGADGGAVYAPCETFDYGAFPCEAVDTTGAGDSFAGAFLYAQTRHLPLGESVELAARCATKTVQVRGPHGFWKLEGSNDA